MGEDKYKCVLEIGLDKFYLSSKSEIVLDNYRFDEKSVKKRVSLNKIEKESEMPGGDL